jgi:hypothetical protein
MTDCGHALEIQRSIEVYESVDAGGDVLERLGPAAAGAGTPILEVPGRETAICEIEA